MRCDFICPSCEQIKRDARVRYVNRRTGRIESVICKQCHIPMKRLLADFAVPHVFPKFGLHLQHVCAGGKTFYSKKEMQKYAKEKDLELGALL